MQTLPETNRATYRNQKGDGLIFESKSRVTLRRPETKRRSQPSIVHLHWSQRKVCTKTKRVYFDSKI